MSVEETRDKRFETLLRYLERSSSPEVAGLAHEIKPAVTRVMQETASYMSVRTLRHELSKYRQVSRVNDLPEHLRDAVREHDGSIYQAITDLTYTERNLGRTVNLEMGSLREYVNRLEKILPQDDFHRKVVYSLRYVLFGEKGKLYKEHPHGHKFAVLAIVLASFGAASWLWVWKALQQQPTTSLAVASLPGFSYANILFSILILGGLAYGFMKIKE